MNEAASVREEEGDSLTPPAEDRRVQIVSPPFRLRALAWCGVALLLAAFYLGRQLRIADSGASPGAQEPQAAALQALPAAAASAAPVTIAQPTAAEAKQSAVVTVEVRLMKFSPANVELHAGDAVEWSNRDLTPHTATAADKRFDSGSINPNASWRYTFKEPGTYPYVCTFHPEMKGTVVVK